MDFFNLLSKWLTEKKAVILLIIFGSLVYFNGLFAAFAWDDFDQILNNIPVHSITNFFTFFTGGNVYSGTSKLFGIYYKPIMSVIFSLIYSIFGPNPSIFHLVQIIIHIFNSILIFWLFKRFFQKATAFITSLVFLIHPINTEAVIFVSALQDTLFMLFGLLALRIVTEKKLSNRSIIWLVILLLLSILSKESGLLFFAILPLFMLIYKKKGFWKLISGEAIAFGIYLFMRVILAGIGITTQGHASIMQISPVERLLTMTKIFLYYFQTFIFPKNLSIAQLWVVHTPTLFDFYIPMLLDVIIILLVVAVYFWLKKVQADMKQFYFFVSWLTIGIIFHLQIIPLDMTVAERWFYFPMIGLLGVVCVIAKNIQLNKKYLSNIFFICLILILTGLSLRTILRNDDWSSALKLYEHDAEFSKNNVILDENIGFEYMKRNNIDKAQFHFQRALELEPDLSVVWYNLAVIAGKKQDYKLAKTYYQKAIDLGGSISSYENLAVLSFAYGTLEEAERNTKTGLQKIPNDPKLWLIYALTEYKLKKHDEALMAAKNAYLLSPNTYTAGVYNAINKNLPIQDPKINFE